MRRRPEMKRKKIKPFRQMEDFFKHNILLSAMTCHTFRLISVRWQRECLVIKARRKMLLKSWYILLCMR